MVEVANIAKARVDVKKLKRVAQRVLKEEGKERADLSIAIVQPKRMQELNKQYRGKDKATNVLSFAAKEPSLGEVVLCPQVIRQDAKKYGILFDRAMRWMLIHGILHLLGYTHKSMSKKEAYYLSLK